MDFNPWQPAPKGATPQEVIAHNEKCINALKDYPDQSAGIYVGCLQRQNSQLKKQLK